MSVDTGHKILAVPSLGFSFAAVPRSSVLAWHSKYCHFAIGCKRCSFQIPAPLLAVCHSSLLRSSLTLSPLPFSTSLEASRFGSIITSTPTAASSCYGSPSPPSESDLPFASQARRCLYSILELGMVAPTNLDHRRILPAPTWMDG